DVQAAITTVQPTLPPALVHGDATVANLIPGPHGPVICDFDSTSYGPAEWDLTPVAVGHLRFGNTANQPLLAAGYGFDLPPRRRPDHQLVTGVVPVPRSTPPPRKKRHHRLQTFRSGNMTARWERYT